MGLHSYLTTLMILRHSNANAITKGKMRDSVAQETVSHKYYLNQIFPGEIDKLLSQCSSLSEKAPGSQWFLQMISGLFHFRKASETIT